MCVWSWKELIEREREGEKRGGPMSDKEDHYSGAIGQYVDYWSSVAILKKD